MKKKFCAPKLSRAIGRLSSQLAKQVCQLEEALALANQHIARLKAINSSHQAVCKENDGLRARIRELEIELSSLACATILPQKKNFKSANSPFSKIKKLVADKFGIPLINMGKRSGREDWQSWPRHIAMTICYRKNLGTCHEVALAFGYTDHGIVLHAGKVVDAVLQNNNDHARRKEYLDCVALCEKHVVPVIPTATAGS